MDALLVNARPRLVVSDPQWCALLEDRSGPNGCAAFVSPSDKTAGASGISATPVPDDIAFLQYSSGTTGLKKGVAITHRALLWQIDAYAEAIGMRDRDVVVSWLPLYHDMGLIACLFFPLLRRVPLVALSPFDWVRRPGLLLRAVSDFRGTLCWLPNFAFSFLARNVSQRDLEGIDLSSLRGVVNCSEPISASSHRAFLKVFVPRGLRPDSIAASYALAENTFAVTSGGFGKSVVEDTIDREIFAREGRAVSVGSVPSFPGAVRTWVGSGRPLPATRIEIVDEEGRVLPERHVGEILLRSPCLMREYHRNPEATAAALRVGVLRTGDIGYLAGEELFVTGRKKDLIIVGGQNVYPQDVESTLHDLPGVVPGRSVAFGIADEERGTERLVVMAETTCDGPDEKERIRGLIFERVTSETLVTPSDVCVVPPRFLLKSTSGKIARAANRDRYLEMIRGTEPEAWTSSPEVEAHPLIESVRRCVIESLDRSPVTRGRRPRDDESIVASGLIDSLELASVILAVENACDMRFPSTAIANLSHFDTIQRIVALVEKSRESKPEAEIKVATDAETRSNKCLHYLASDRRTDLLILGSSRAMPLHTALADSFGYNSFNFTVASAGTEDLYCILRFVLDRNTVPLRRILLSLDIEMFSPEFGVDFRLPRCRLLRDYLDPNAPPGRITFEEMRSMEASTDPFPEDRLGAIRMIQKTGVGPEIEGFYCSPKGDYIFDRRPEEPRRPQCIQDPHDKDADCRVRFRGFACLCPSKVYYFENFLRLCTKHKIEVTVWLSTLHPVAERFLLKHCSYAERIEDLRSILPQLPYPGLQLLNYSLPAHFGGLDEDFRDATHMGEINSDLLLRHILSGDR